MLQRLVSPNSLHTAAARPAVSFLFDHIPKTAGSSLRLVFEQIFGPENVSPHINIGKTERWADRNLSRYRMVFGHFHYPVPLAGLSRDRVRMTMLRHPVDRAISEYFFFRNDVTNAPWDPLVRLAKEKDLLSYVKSLQASGNIAIANRYAHHFATQFIRVPWTKMLLRRAALKAIDRFDFVGVQEQFTDFADVFCATYGLPLYTTMPRANRTSARVTLEELDAPTRDVLTEMNDLDIEIYETVKARFERVKRGIFRKVAENRDTGEMGRYAGTSEAGAANSEPEFPEKATGEHSPAEICEGRVQGPYGHGRPVRGGEIARISFVVAVHEEQPGLSVGIEISDDVGDIVFVSRSQLPAAPVPARTRHLVTFAVKMDVRHGRYHVSGTLGAPGSQARPGTYHFDRIASFEVIDGNRGTQIGYCHLETNVHWERRETAVPA